MIWADWSRASGESCVRVRGRRRDYGTKTNKALPRGLKGCQTQMFAARGIAVSLSTFVIVYCVLSLAITCVPHPSLACVRRLSVRRAADVLFALRMFPLVTAALVTAVFTAPSFLLLEPRSID